HWLRQGNFMSALARKRARPGRFRRGCPCLVGRTASPSSPAGSSGLPRVAASGSRACRSRRLSSRRRRCTRAWGSARRLSVSRRCGGVAHAVAYDPRAPALAVVSTHGIALVRRWDRPPSCARLHISASPFAAGWLEGGQVVLAVNRGLGSSLERLSGTKLNEAG